MLSEHDDGPGDAVRDQVGDQIARQAAAKRMAREREAAKSLLELVRKKNARIEELEHALGDAKREIERLRQYNAAQKSVIAAK